MIDQMKANDSYDWEDEVIASAYSAQLLHEGRVETNPFIKSLNKTIIH